MPSRITRCPQKLPNTVRCYLVSSGVTWCHQELTDALRVPSGVTWSPDKLPGMLKSYLMPLEMILYSPGIDTGMFLIISRNLLIISRNIPVSIYFLFFDLHLLPLRTRSMEMSATSGWHLLSLNIVSLMSGGIRIRLLKLSCERLFSVLEMYLVLLFFQFCIWLLYVDAAFVHGQAIVEMDWTFSDWLWEHISPKRNSSRPKLLGHNQGQETRKSTDAGNSVCDTPSLPLFLPCMFSFTLKGGWSRSRDVTFDSDANKLASFHKW